MDSLLKEVASAFGLGVAPKSSEIVVWDGFDQLEKESAVKYYTAKTWPEVLLHLRNLKYEFANAQYYLEEWSVLSHKSLSYFLRAHLEFLLDPDQPPDAEFVFHLFGQLYQAIYMHNGSPFSAEQTQLLKKIAHCIEGIAKGKEFYDDVYNSDIVFSVVRFLEELRKHDPKTS